MILNIDTCEDGRWFTWFYSHLDPNTMEAVHGDPIEDGPQMKIRNPAPLWKEQNRNVKTTTKMVPNPKTRGMDAVKIPVDLTSEEDKANDEAYADYVIMEVKDFELNNKAITGTREEKIEMMKTPQVFMFVMRCVQILQESSVQEAVAEGKNSLTGSSSLTTKLDPE